MGQKVNPHGLRVGIIKDWGAKWYADDKQFGDLLVEDNKIRKYLKEKLYAISREPPTASKLRFTRRSPAL